MSFIVTFSLLWMVNITKNIQKRISKKLRKRKRV
nr:MAG TPA: hypothetical protein [Caudoviricetes sp.]